MRPVNAHLALKQDRNAFAASDRDRRPAALHAGVHGDDPAGDRRIHADAVRQRLHRQQSRHRHRASADHLSGLRTVQHFIGPLVGSASDSFGKFPTFAFGTALSIIMVLIYTHLGHVSLTTAIVVNVLMFVGIFSRMIPSQALISAIPGAEPARLVQRGQRLAAAALRRPRLGAGRRHHRAKCRRLAAAFRLAGLHRGRDALVSLTLMYFVQKSVAARAGRQMV